MCRNSEASVLSFPLSFANFSIFFLTRVYSFAFTFMIISRRPHPFLTGWRCIPSNNARHNCTRRLRSRTVILSRTCFRAVSDFPAVSDRPRRQIESNRTVHCLPLRESFRVSRIYLLCIMNVSRCWRRQRTPLKFITVPLLIDVRMHHRTLPGQIHLELIWALHSFYCLGICFGKHGRRGKYKVEKRKWDYTQTTTKGRSSSYARVRVLYTYPGSCTHEPIRWRAHIYRKGGCGEAWS